MRGLERRVTVMAGDKTHDYVCRNRTEVWRAKTLFSKEEGTCAWLNSELRAGDVFYDIGANIGLYTVLAGNLLKGSGAVYAFEPHSNNFASLCRNIMINGLGETVFAVNLALNDADGLFHFNYSSWEPGTSTSQLIDWAGTERPEFAELKSSARCDRLVDSKAIPAPTVVKIDVDGREMSILKGMTNILGSTSRPRALQVEIAPGEADAIKSFMSKIGYRYDSHHLTMGGKFKLERGRSLDTIAYNAIFRAE